MNYWHFGNCDACDFQLTVTGLPMSGTIPLQLRSKPISNKCKWRLWPTVQLLPLSPVGQIFKTGHQVKVGLFCVPSFSPMTRGKKIGAALVHLLWQHYSVSAVLTKNCIRLLVAPYAGPGYDAQDEGGHAIRVIGWGVSKVNGKSYWLIANSWGTDVGDKGVYQIEMGRNVVGIEGTISAPIVKLPNTCGSFCDAPLDQIIRSKPTDPKSPVFAFQGRLLSIFHNSFNLSKGIWLYCCGGVQVTAPCKSTLALMVKWPQLVHLDLLASCSWEVRQVLSPNGWPVDQTCGLWT